MCHAVLSSLFWTTRTWPRGYKTFFMLNSAELEIYPAQNVKMPTIVMSRINYKLLSTEPEFSTIFNYFNFMSS